LSSIGVTAFTAKDLSPVSATQYLADVAVQQANGSVPSGYLNVTDTAANIEALSPATLDSGQIIGLGQLTATDASVVLTVAQLRALETQLVPVVVPTNDTVTIVDTAANLQSLTAAEIAELPFIGVSAIAAKNAPAVLSATEVADLGNAGVVVVAPPNDPSQNDGSLVISNPSGTGITFDVTFDSSVASAPTGFIAAVSAAFQFYANLFTNPITVYYNVGYGEVAGSALGSGDLGESLSGREPESYTALVAALDANATSSVQKEADASLPAADPTGGLQLQMTSVEAQTLGFTNFVAKTAADPDGQIGFSSLTSADPFNYSLDQVPVSGEYDFIGAVEHEISEVLGRSSLLDHSGQYEPMDLFRYAAADMRQLSPTGDPSYFSIDNGATHLDAWNNFTTGNNGDLGDWAGTTPYTPNSYNDNSNPGVVNPITPTDIVLMNALGYDVNPDASFTAAYLEALTPGGIDELASVGITQLVASDTSVTLTVIQAQAFEAASLSVAAPAGDQVIIADSLTDIELLTGSQLAGLAAIGVSQVALTETSATIEATLPLSLAIYPGLGITEIISTDTSVGLSVAQAKALEGAGIQVIAPSNDVVLVDTASAIEGLTKAQIAALPGTGVTSIIANNASVMLSVVQAVALEAVGIGITAPAHDTVTIFDTAAQIETLTAAEISALPGVGVTAIDATDASVTLTVAQAVALEGVSIPVAAPAGDSVTISDTVANLLKLTAGELAGLPAIGVSRIDPTGSLVSTITGAAGVAGTNGTNGTNGGSGIINGSPTAVAGGTGTQGTGGAAGTPGGSVDNVLTGGTLGTAALPIPATFDLDIQIDAIGGAGGEGGHGSDGGNGGDGDPAGSGGAGTNSGNSGAGGAATSLIEDLSTDLNYGGSITAQAQGGAGAAGNIETTDVGGDGGRYYVNGAYTSQTGAPGPDGSLGDGGAGGNAAASITNGNFTAAITLTLQVVADGGEGGDGGDGVDYPPGPAIGGVSGAASASLTKTTATVGTSLTAGNLFVKLAVNNYLPGLDYSGSAASETVVMTGNTLTLGAGPNGFGFGLNQSTLNLELSSNTDDQFASYPNNNIQNALNGASGGNLMFSGNVLNGGGNGVLDLTETDAAAVVDTWHDTLSLGGSTANSLSGFNQFQLQGTASFVTGPGNYNIEYTSTGGSSLSVVITPYAGSLVIEGGQYDGVSDVVLDFEGFGTALNASLLAADTTQSGGDTYIAVPGIGGIELYDDTATIPSASIEFNTLPMLTQIAVSVAQMEAFAAADTLPPAGSTYVVTDLAANIEGATAAQLGRFAAFGASAIVATDASVVLTLAQAEALADQFAIHVPAGDSVTVRDSASAIEALSTSVIAIMRSTGVTAINAQAGSIALTVAQAEAFTAAGLGVAPGAGGTLSIADNFSPSLTPTQIAGFVALGVTQFGVPGDIILTAAQVAALEPSLRIIAPSGDTVYLQDTAAALSAMSAAQFAGLVAIGITAVYWTTSPLVLSAAQALGLPGNNGFQTLTVADTAANIELLQPAQIAALKADGVTGITVTSGGPLVLSVLQAQALEDPLPITGAAVVIQDLAATIENDLTTADIAPLKTVGVTSIQATDAALLVGVAVAQALENAGITLAAPGIGGVSIKDTAAAIAGLSNTQITALKGIGITAIKVSGTGGSLTAAQISAFTTAGLTLSAAPGAAVTLSETVSAISALTVAQIQGFQADGIIALYAADANSGFPASISVAAAAALEAASIKITVPAGATVWLSDSTADMASLTAAQIAQLPGIGVSEIYDYGEVLGFTLAQFQAIQAAGLLVYDERGIAIQASVADVAGFTASDVAAFINAGVSDLAIDGSVSFTITEAETFSGLYLSAPAGDAIAVSDSAANIQNLTQPQIDTLAGIGVTALIANGLVTLNLSQASLLEQYGFTLSAPGGDTVSLVDTASNLTQYLEYGLLSLAGLAALGVTAITATGGSPDLSVASIETLESLSIIVTAPGHTLVLADNAATIETNLTAQDIAGFPAIGVSAITVTDGSVVFDVGQALALEQAGITVSVPPGATVDVQDSEAALGGLTTAQIAGLAALGFAGIAVSSLAGLALLTIEAGLTLAIDGAVPSAETIIFAGTRGVLSLDDTPDMAGTIYGFSPPDAIDLTDATYDPSATANLDTANNMLTVIESSGTYDVQLDPSQVFLTTPDFVAQPDAGTGTEVTYVQATVTTYVQVLAEQTVDGAVISAAGEAEVQSGGTANRTIIENRGYLLADSGSTITDAFINSGGTLELGVAVTTGGAITFGPTSVGRVGGTLDIDDTTMPAATLADVAPGDVIDLTAIGYDPAGTATIESGNTLQIIEAGATYDLRLDPTQAFLNQSFTLSADSNGGTDIIEVQAPVSGSAAIPALMHVDQALVANGGSVAIQPAGTLNGGTAAAGGTITVQAYATLTNGLINGGGTVDLAAGGDLGQAISFGSDGGTLQVDGSILPTATIDGFGGGDVIDLTGIAYQSGAVPFVTGGHQLRFTENGTTYSLNIDPSQAFFGSFTLRQDTGTGTDIVLNQGPGPFGGGVASGSSAAGLTFVSAANGGADQFYIFGSLVNATIDAGTTVDVWVGGTISYGIIEAGGLLELTDGAHVTGPLGFGTPGGTLEIDSPFLPTAPITGVAAGDIIDLRSISFDASGTATVASGNQLQIIENGATYGLQLDPMQTFSGAQFQLATDTSNGTFITEELPCFLSGTRILSAQGGVAVEDLEVGNRVLTAAGVEKPVVWLGHRRVDCRHHPSPEQVWPVRIKAGGFGPDLPHRDLWLSPNHAVLIEGVLIPIKYLINQDTIAQIPCEEATYYHVELPQHDILIAEGTPAESYLDTGDRPNFANGGPVMRLFPDFSTPALSLATIWEARGYAPLVVYGPELESARALVNARAAAVHETRRWPEDCSVFVSGRALYDSGKRTL
jgi:hypothetical protein